MDYFIDCMTKKYATFSGRARRSEYWYFVLFNLLTQFVLGFIVGFLFGVAGGSPDTLQIVCSLITLAFVIPGLAVTVRRLHDTGKSGWWVLIALIPYVGPFILLFFLVKDSDPETNDYGPNPKAIAN